MPGGKLNQFVSWNGTAWASPSRTVNYGWDKAGNRDNVNENGTVTGYTNNNINQYSAVGAQTVNNAGGHQISKYANVAYAYIGDTFVAQITTVNGSTVTNSYHLQYDALGRAVQRELNGTSTYFLFEGDHWVMQYRKSTTDVTKLAEYGNALYGLGIDEVIVRNNNGQGQFLYQDWLGSTSMVLGFAAEKLESYSYDAFGKPTIRNPAGTDITATGRAINNTIMFTGREYDSLFGIYEYQPCLSPRPRPLHNRRPERLRCRRLQSVSLLRQ
jgi:hypothetical protein